MREREAFHDESPDWIAGDDAGFEALFRREYASLVRFAHRYVRDPGAAEDIVQDVFLALWQGRDRPPQPDAVRGYLFRAVRNRSLNHLRSLGTRRRAAAQLAAAADTSIDPDTGAADAARVRAALHAAIDALPARCRLIFTLSRDHGLSYREIAASLGVSIKTVETQMGRALRTLRERLERYRP